MANSSSSAALAASNPHSNSVQSEAPSVIDGVVRHPHLSASEQVQILSIIDATGSASIGDIVAELPGHQDPVDAILALVAAGELTLEFRGILDENTIVRRTTRDLDPDGAVAPVAVMPVPPDFVAAAGHGGGDLPAGLEQLGCPFMASVVVGPGDARRSFGRVEALHRPGVYGLMNETSIYIGMGSDVGLRVADGRQPIENIEKVFVIVDAFGNLTAEGALIAERTLSSRAGASGELEVINQVPIGAPCDVQLFSEIDSFIGQAALALHHHGYFFGNGSARSVLAGPRAEAGRIGPTRLFDELPSGELFELHFGAGLVAHAAKQAEDRWILLRGSDVRIAAAPSGNRGIHYSRSNWLHSGLITLSPDGRSFVVQKDLVFPNGSSTAQFCAGGKGRALSAWKPVDSDAEDRPDTAALAAA